MSEANREHILREASFDPKIETYWLLSGMWVLAATVAGIALIPIWFLVGKSFTHRYLAAMRCTLTDKTLQIGKGILTRTEKTIPLEKITDMGLVQGPIMRHLGLTALSVETAGQSSQGALVKLAGIVDTHEFRDAVLEQRDRLTAGIDSQASSPTESSAGSESISDATFTDIRDTLHRIEMLLKDASGRSG